MKKYLEYFDGAFDSTVAEKVKPENKPYVAYSKTEGVVYTVASNVGGGKEYISFVDETGSPTIRISCVGSVTISSTYNGAQVSQVVTNLASETVNIQSDPNTEVTLRGKVTSLSAARPQLRARIVSINIQEATSLESLNLYSNGLQTIDVSKNVNLRELSVASNNLTSIDVSENINLEYLDISSNNITSLNVSENINIKTLSADATYVPDVDLSNNKLLEFLSIGYSTYLIDLDISQNEKLNTLYCQETPSVGTISCLAMNELVAHAVASVITNATSVDGTVTLRQGDEFNQTIIDAAMEKGWDVQYRQ